MLQQLKYLTFIIIMSLAISCGEDTETATPDVLIDEYGLYTDLGLAYPLDTALSFVKEEWIKGIKRHAQPIRSLTSDLSFEDLNFLNPILQGKRIVQLGESGHGVKEFNQSKVRLIKYLHEELGYNVLAFESSIFECYQAYNTYARNLPLSTINFMKGSIFGVWHTQELMELFGYIKESHTTVSPLILAGFDVQTSSNTRIQRPQFFKDVLSNIDEVYAQEIFDFDTELNNNLFDSESTFFDDPSPLIKAYDELATFIETNMSSLIENYAGTEHSLHPLMAFQTAKSMSIYCQLNYLSRQDMRDEGIERRDKGMAQNLIYLAEQVYPNEKIIVWAHNFHIRHNNLDVSGEYLVDVTTMGRYTHDYFGDDVYTLGLFMYEGKASSNNRQKYTIEAATENSLEAIMHTTELKYSFLDIESTPENSETSWMYQPSINKSWGLWDLEMVPSEQYNGILFIQSSSSPDYVP